MNFHLNQRSYLFSLRIIKFLRSKKWDYLGIVLVKQLMRSAVSVGANLTEAKNSSTRLEFKRYYEIALKSANETKYWISLVMDGFEEKSDELKDILREADELSRIIAACIIKLKKGI
ncbi:MAG: four helix bundle protein [Bacteroidetes bacterium]|nr:four helix bundle protein [Bacteroidota bacterium]